MSPAQSSLSWPLLLVPFCAGQVFDRRCWEQAAEADQVKCNMDEPCRSDCWSNFFTHSYCCLEDSSCWWWGKDPGGEVIHVDAARSGVECRHICQANSYCVTWTFIFPADRSPDSGGPCVLRGSREPDPSKWQLADGLVSGARTCSADGVSQGPPVLVQNLSDSSFIFDPRDEGYARKAAKALVTEGWAVVRRALTANEVDVLSKAASEAGDELHRRDVHAYGNRGPRRYSFGGASMTHHMLHVAAWANLIENPVITPVLMNAFGGPYVVGGGGGDFVLGSTDTHQKLHVDLQHQEMYSLEQPPAAIVASYAVSTVACNAGPTRFYPRTQTSPLMIAELALNTDDFARNSSLEKESAFQALLRLEAIIACPLEPGDVVLRDMRLWHGGTPNTFNSTRFLPSAEFLSPWYAALIDGTDDHFAARPALPFAEWLRLSDHGRAISRRLLAIEGAAEFGIRERFELMLPYVAEDRP